MKRLCYFLLLSFGFGLQAGSVPAPQAGERDVPVFHVAAVLQSNMVIQQGKPFRLWGAAPSGGEVEITASWSNRTFRVRVGTDGKWLTSIPVPKAIPGRFDTHRIRISHGDSLVELENLLIGEVWMCSGQSNMTYMLDSIPAWGPGVPGYKEEIASADYPQIRLLGVGMALEEEPVEDLSGTWRVCSPETVGSFSAVAYYFGKRLFEQLRVPVGLVVNGLPGAGGQAFASREVLEADSALREKYLEPYRDNPRKEGEHILSTLQRPALIYNGMIHPLRNLSLRGVIWYQGESNRNDGALYTRLSKAMLEGWRKDFDQGPFPFYFVQMPSYTWDEPPGSSSYALFREAQEALLTEENTGMIITLDVGDPDDLHPRDKKPVGERLARLALNKTYGKTHVRFKGPHFTGFKIEGNLVKISFESGDGALTTSDGQAPACFYLSGADRVFYPAEARLKGNQVWLRTEKVPNPEAVRYAFTNASFTNLTDRGGLPAAPFRTDSWDDAVTIAAPRIRFGLSPVLQSSMVIQQEKPFRLWGTAPMGDTVKFSATWLPDTVGVVLADSEGNWVASLDVPQAVPGKMDQHTIRVTHRQDTVLLENLLIGDVWLCAGQSNMDMMIGKVEGWYPGVVDYEKEIAQADYPAIRLIKIHPGFSLEPQSQVKGTWQICSPETAGGFSAVAYFFGRELHQKLNIPIGLVVSAVPGASGQAFTPRDVLESDPLLNEKYLDPFLADLESQAKIDSSDFFRRVTRPTLIYNAMIHPLEKLSITGFIWYQGESNHSERESYTRLCSAMLESWRARFGQGELPFYFTQIAPYEDRFDSTGTISAYFREAQEAMLTVRNTGMAVTMDVGEKDNVHPSEKKSVGRRLAAQALQKTYGQELIAQGPGFSGMDIRGKKVRVSFEPGSLGSGLTTSDAKTPAHFYLAGADKVFYPASARIKDNQVWLKSRGVKRPVAVRYAFANAVITNLQNKEGFPAIPFRTDDWDHAGTAGDEIRKD